MDVELDDGSTRGPGGLLERLEALDDPRSRNGRRHALAGLLAIAAAAVLAGARSYTATAEFAREVPQATLARQGIWQRPYATWYVAPSETTLRRVLQQIDADELDRVVGGWLAEQQPARAADQPGAVAVDGKTVRGAVGEDGRKVHLFAALAHGSGTVLAQRQVDAKTNELTQFRPLLDQVDLVGKVVTADALHTKSTMPAGWSSMSTPTMCYVSRTTNPAWSARSTSCSPARFPRSTERLTAATAASSIAVSNPPRCPQGCGSPPPGRCLC